jgi:hypothetical protein
MSDVAATDVYRGLPRRIHVGATTFRVVITTPEAAEGGQYLADADGCCVFDEFRLYLRDDLPLQRAVNVVKHEVTHAINWVYGVDDESTEEQFTTQHTNGELEVWVRNPRLLNWLVKQVRRMKKEASRD